jgi:hemerythrin
VLRYPYKDEGVFMAFYDWQESFSVGIKEMDDQHKKLIAIINHLHEAMISGQGKSEIGKIIEEMLEYTKFHFTAEEALMTEYKYPGLPVQKNEHSAFIKKTQAFQSDLESGKLALSLEVSTFLKDWLTNHIMINDKKYSGMKSK